MSLIRIISQKANEQQLPFLLIGGYAVMAHGFARSTYDLDFLIRKNQTEDWRRLLEGLGFKIHFTGPTFVQFEPPAGEKLPLDVMLVSDETFVRMQAEAKRIEADGVATSIVSLPHLIALKCHAICQGKPHRAMKDIEDLVQLARLNKLDLNDPSLRDIILKHGNKELYETLKRDCGGICPE
ncbi:MAG: nucleotidyl transferase AbiEii/AbiGii toxin family protein [Verrucomicrobiota bacterium]|jgi:predicted nucleotidyltransferase